VEGKKYGRERSKTNETHLACAKILAEKASPCRLWKSMTPTLVGPGEPLSVGFSAGECYRLGSSARVNGIRLFRLVGNAPRRPPSREVKLLLLLYSFFSGADASKCMRRGAPGPASRFVVSTELRPREAHSGSRSGMTPSLFKSIAVETFVLRGACLAASPASREV